MRHAYLYNARLPQSALGSQPLLQATKDWRKSHPQPSSCQWPIVHNNIRNLYLRGQIYTCERHKGISIIKCTVCIMVDRHESIPKVTYVIGYEYIDIIAIEERRSCGSKTI